jgi:hypothetical protein
MKGERFGLAIDRKPVDQINVSEKNTALADADARLPRAYASVDEIAQSLRRQTEQGSSIRIGVGKAETGDNHGRNPSLDSAVVLG